jgi:hypothetical protein
MKKQGISKLVLSRETVRILDDRLKRGSGRPIYESHLR